MLANMTRDVSRGEYPWAARKKGTLIASDTNMNDLMDFVTDRRMLPLCMQHVSPHLFLTFGVDHEHWGCRDHVSEDS